MLTILAVLLAELLWACVITTEPSVDRFLAYYRASARSPEEMGVVERVTYSLLLTRAAAHTGQKTKTADPKVRRPANSPQASATSSSLPSWPERASSRQAPASADR